MDTSAKYHEKTGQLAVFLVSCGQLSSNLEFTCPLCLMQASPCVLISKEPNQDREPQLGSES